MRWFKHLTASWEDEKLSAITCEHGLEIYGFWWRLLEIVGKQMDATDRDFCQYSDKVWGKFCGISAKKFRSFADILAEKELINLKNGQNEVTIKIPNLLKYRDEFTKRKSKKSGVDP